MRIAYITRPSEIIGGDQLAASWHAEEMMSLGYDITKNIDSADVVIMWSGCSPDWGLSAAQIVKDNNKPLIIVANWWNRKRRQAFFGLPEDVAPGYTNDVKRLLSMADVLAVCTMSEAQECWKLVPRAKVFLMGSGPGEIVVDPMPPEDYVCCIGRIEPHKNQVVLAAACRENGMPLVLIGPKQNKEYFVWTLEQGGSINWMGEMNRKDSQEILARARVHALPSFSETPGLSNSEALALGVPSVMGNIGAECEFYGENGMYCTPDSIGDVADALKEAWNIKRSNPVIIQTWKETASRTDKWINNHV